MSVTLLSLENDVEKKIVNTTLLVKHNNGKTCLDYNLLLSGNGIGTWSAMMTLDSNGKDVDECINMLISRMERMVEELKKLPEDSLITLAKIKNDLAGIYHG